MIDDARVEQLISRLVEVRIGDLELVSLALERHSCGEIDLALAKVDAIRGRRSAAPRRGVLDVSEGCHLGRNIGNVGDVRQVLGIDIADRPVQRQRTEPQLALGLEALQPRLAGVGNDPAEAWQAAERAGDRTGDLDIGVVHPEGGERDGEAAVEQGCLVADLVAVHLFGAEAQELGNFGIGLGAVTIEIGGVRAGPARIEPAALEALREAHVKLRVRVGLEAQRGARGELGESLLAAEIGARRTGRDPRSAEGRRPATEVVLPQDLRAAFVPGVAPADREAELVAEIVSEIGKGGHRLGIDIGVGIAGQPIDGGEQPHVELGQRRRTEVIGADQTVEVALVDQHLHFLAELAVAVIAGHVDIDRRQCVEVDRGRRIVLAVSRNRAERQAVGGLRFEEQRGAPGGHILHREVEPASGVIDVGQHRGAADDPGDEPVPAARVRGVVGVIGGQPREHIGAVQFDRAAPGPDVLVVVVQPVGQVGAEPVAGEPRQRAADADDLVGAQCDRAGNHSVGLVVAAVSGARRKVGHVVKPLGHVLDRAADSVAAVQRALRPAQHFDPLNIVDIEHRGLRPVEIDIVEIDPDTLFEARNRVLLADPADERAQCRIGRAAGFERHVGNGLGQRGDIGRALIGELVARDRRDRDRHVEQAFLAAACGDDDRVAIILGGGGSIARIAGGLRERRGGGQADESAGDQ